MDSKTKEAVDAWVVGLQARLLDDVMDALSHAPSTLPDWLETRAIYDGEQFMLRVEFGGEMNYESS